MAAARLVPGREKRVLGGHPWVFRSDIERVEGAYQDGDIVSVLSAKGAFLGKAYINMKSQIALRFMTTRDEEIDAAFISARVKRAIDYRRTFADMRSCRLIFAESDFLPALIVDKFNDILVCQFLSLGIDRLKPLIVKALAEQLSPAGIYERSDAPVRALEGLEQIKGLLYGEVPGQVVFQENGISFQIDVINGQKTGYFLDQKENRAAIAPFVKGARVLDCCCHVGSFALHAAKYGAKEVTGVDVSAQAVAASASNATLNGLENVEFVEANCFDYLRALGSDGRQFDTIVLDPPAFTKSRASVPGATRGYKDINLRAMKLLPEGGYLISCSCSHHIDAQAFMEIIKSAARDAGRTLRLVELRSQGKDHPTLPASPETQYLKCAILQVF